MTGLAATARERTGVVPAEVLDQLSAGYAIAEPGTWTVRYENERFRTWFPAAPVPGAAQPTPTTLPARLPAFDEVRARERLSRGRPYRLETAVVVGPRSTAVVVDVTHEDVAGETVVLVQAHNITKQREAEYMLDSYSRLMERQARALEQEKERAERLLLNIMPRSVAAELRDFGTTTPQSFKAASVLMLDFVGFTEMAISREPGPLIAELNDVFTSFDRIMEHSSCERIKTIGDGYMAVAGVPEPDPDHEFNIARAALRMRKFLERRNTSAVNRWQCRIGIGYGPVIGSIVGVQKYVYDIFGPAVNMAARLEGLCDPMQILVSAELTERIHDDFVLRSVGTVDIKGFGLQEVFALEGEARKGRQ
jgi:adenylate cyclase